MLLYYWCFYVCSFYFIYFLLNIISFFTQSLTHTRLSCFRLFLVKMAHYLFLAVTVIVLGTKPAASVIVWDEKSLPPDQTILIQQKYLKDKYTKVKSFFLLYEQIFSGDDQA